MPQKALSYLSGWEKKFKMFSSPNDIDMHTLYAPVLHKPVVGRTKRQHVGWVAVGIGAAGGLKTKTLKKLTQTKKGQ